MITRNNCLENPHLEDVFKKKKISGLWNMHLMAVWVGFLILKLPGYVSLSVEISHFMKDFPLKAS